MVIRYIITESIPQTLYVTLDTPLNNSAGSENNTFNYTTIGTNSTYNCSIYFNGTLNQTATTGNNTLSTFNVTGLGVGEWLWNVTCWLNPTTYNVSETRNYTVVITTTTTTTTTTTSGTTTTTQGTPSTNSTNYIFTILVSVFAFILMCLTFILIVFFPKTQDISTLFPPAFLSSIMWFAASYMTTRIRFIDAFGSGNTWYIDAGNTEVGLLYSFFGFLMGILSLIILLGYISQRSKKI